MSMWAGVAIVGIWVGVGLSAFGAFGARGAVISVALFAMLATLSIAAATIH